MIGCAGAYWPGKDARTTESMELENLRTFVEVMRRGSFAAVARDRNIDPSSVSRAVAKLEQELGVRLFNRTTRHLSPTEAALAYFDKVESLTDELEGAAHVAADAGEMARGTLRITAPVTFTQLNLVPLLPEFAQRFPLLSFDLVLTDNFLDLVEERIDLGVRLGRLAESSLIAHRLCDAAYVVCASPAYLKRKGRPKAPADLEHHECLRYRYPMTGCGESWRFKEGGGPVLEVPIRGRVIATNGIALTQCAAAGMGILMLYRWNVAAELRSGALVDLFPQYHATPTEFDTAVWLLYPSRSYLPLKVRAFADFLKEKFKNGAPAEAGLAPNNRLRRSPPAARKR